MAKREESASVTCYDPVQLLEEVKQGEKRGKELQKRISGLERELQERQDEIKSLEDLQREEKQRQEGSPNTAADAFGQASCFQR
eukprot:scaffold101210_cov46-Prasinocladus_malaysianus.AAC.1